MEVAPSSNSMAQEFPYHSESPGGDIERNHNTSTVSPVTVASKGTPQSLFTVRESESPLSIESPGDDPSWTQAHVSTAASS